MWTEPLTVVARNTGLGVPLRLFVCCSLLGLCSAGLGQRLFVKGPNSFPSTQRSSKPRCMTRFLPTLIAQGLVGNQLTPYFAVVAPTNPDQHMLKANRGGESNRGYSQPLPELLIENWGPSGSWEWAHFTFHSNKSPWYLGSWSK